MYLKLLTNRNNKGERKQLCMKKIRKIKCLFGPGWERGVQQLGTVTLAFCGLKNL